MLVVGPSIRTGDADPDGQPARGRRRPAGQRVAAYDRVRDTCVVVDFGTAITYDVVSAAGEYLGGIITPGAEISIDALYERAAKLPKVELATPRSLSASRRSTRSRSGIVFGFAGQVDGIVGRLREELGSHTKVLADREAGPALVPEVRETIDEVDDLLTLTGLRLIWERNVGPVGLACPVVLWTSGLSGRPPGVFGNAKPGGEGSGWVCLGVEPRRGLATVVSVCVTELS